MNTCSVCATDHNGLCSLPPVRRVWISWNEFIKRNCVDLEAMERYKANGYKFDSDIAREVAMKKRKRK